MSFPSFPMWIYPLVGASVLLAFALKIWHPFKKPLNPIGLILISGAEWLLMHAFELSTNDLALKIILLKLKYVGIVMLPISWYLTAITYNYLKKNERILPRLLIIIVPLITLLLAFTNEYHGLFWTNIYLQSDNPFMEVTTTKRWGYWIFIIFSYSLVVIGLAPYIKNPEKVRESL